MAAVDMFLKIDDLKGESQDATHKGEIDVMSFSFGASQLGGGAGKGGGGGAGKVSFQDFHFSAPVNVLSPRLFQACATGEHFKKAVLSVRKAGGEGRQDFLKITLTDILVSSYQMGSKQLDSGYSNLAEDDSNLNDVPADQISLNFHKVEILYAGQSVNGDGVTGAAAATVD